MGEYSRTINTLAKLKKTIKERQNVLGPRQLQQIRILIKNTIEELEKER